MTACSPFLSEILGLEAVVQTWGNDMRQRSEGEGEQEKTYIVLQPPFASLAMSTVK